MHLKALRHAIGARSLNRRAQVLVACLITALLCESAPAQFPWSSLFERALQSSVDVDAVHIFGESCTLSEAQLHAAQRILADHQVEFAKFVEQGKIRKTEQDKAVSEFAVATLARLEADFERERILADIADEQNRLDDHCLDNLMSILAESQSACWQTFVMRFNRHRWSSAPSMYAEETIDMTSILEEVVENAGLELESHDLDLMLTAYSTRMNEALLKLRDHDVEFSRNYYRGQKDRWKTDGEKVWMGEADDPGKVDRWFATRLNLHKRRRDVNREYLSLVRGLTPETLQEQFTQDYFTAVLDEITSKEKFPAREWIAKVTVVESLNKDQREAIKALSLEFGMKADQFAHRVIKVQEREGDGHYWTTNPEEKKALEDAVKQEVEFRRELDRHVIESVWLQLNDEQRLAVDRPVVKIIDGGEHENE